MTDSDADKVHLVTGVLVAVDDDEQMVLVGMLSDSPFSKASEQVDAQKHTLVGTFAFTKRQAEFLKERLDEFLQNS
ncbi:MAG: hypothetical protein AAF609_14510 [Cyanobacteria bacterium P01_C01_bin.120]